MSMTNLFIGFLNQMVMLWPWKRGFWQRGIGNFIIGATMLGISIAAINLVVLWMYLEKVRLGGSTQPHTKFEWGLVFGAAALGGFVCFCCTRPERPSKSISLLLVIIAVVIPMASVFLLTQAPVGDFLAFSIVPALLLGILCGIEQFAAARKFLL